MKKLYLYLLILLFSFGSGSLVAQNYVSFDATYGGNCGPVNVSFTNTSSLPDTISPVYFEWRINDRLYSTDFNPPDTVMPAGNHNISLLIWDAGGFFSDFYQDVFIQGFGNIRTMPEEICPGEVVRFHLEGQAEWVIWKFPDGTTSNQWDETYVFPSDSTYEVKAIGSTWECGLDSTTANIVVSAGATPRAEIWVNGDWFCPNDEIKFSSPEAAGHQWVINKTASTFTDTIFGREIFYAFSDTGEYTVNLTTTNGCANTNTASHIINIGLDSYTNAWFDEDYGPNNCPNNTIRFEAQASGQFEWNFGDGSHAYERVVFNSYSDTGTYAVQLITRNGCGKTDTLTKDIYIQYYPLNIPNVNIRFKERDSEIDTLKVCPGTIVQLESEVWNDDDIELTWTVASDTFHTKNLIYTFITPGINTVQLIATNNCMGADTLYRYVLVDNAMPPVVDLMASPYAICPGEEVYFWTEGGHDEWHQDYVQNLVYEIDFGDGNTMSNITGQTVEFPPVLAAHTYAALGTYPFLFTAQNSCGIKDTLSGDILVSNDANRDPFYYVGNSTNDDEGGKMEDWSTPVPYAHEFIIAVDSLNWNANYPMQDSAYLFMWYGHIDPNEDPGPPDGIVGMKVPDIVSAYVPYNVIDPNVGIAVVWYCNPGDFDSDVQLYALPLDTGLNMVQSFPIQKDSVTTLTSLPYISGPMILDGAQWTDGPCLTSSSAIRNRWYYQANQGYYVALEIWEEQEGALRYNLNYGPDRWDTHYYVSNGDLAQLNDSTFQFDQLDDQRCFASNFQYKYNIVGDQMTLINLTDTCLERTDLLTGKPFMRDTDNWDYDYKKDRTGCPGDTIELYIAGGISYNWFLTDGATSTQAQFYHVYPDTGKFEELVVATNACSRIDSIYTTVIIDTTNIPEAYWHANKWDVRRMEPVQFMVDYNDDDINNNVYLWEFGDGNTSTKKSPTHFYTNEGDYEVSLTVTNGCGSTTETQTVWVKRNIATCIAKFTYDVSGKTVSFNNNSIGEISSYRWDFGNGKISTLRNPVHTYQNFGVYEVSLIIHDTLTNCSDQVSMIIKVGAIECYANFTYQVNETNQNVIFTDESQGSINSWYWEFGDGTFSTDTFPMHNYANTGVYPVCLTVSNDATGCISHICKEVTIGDVDIYADFNYFVETGTKTVTFSDNSDGEITNWYWEFGDGAWDTIPNTSHTYAESGEYHVCLGTYNAITGAFDDVCKDVVVADTGDVITKAKFTYIVNPATSEVKFIDQSTGEITNWYWTLGDGTYQSGDTITHTYGAPGFYTVCLTVFNGTTGERSEVCKTIQVGIITCNTNAEFGYYVNPTTAEVSFTDKSTGTVNSWFWDFGDGTTSSRENPKHIYGKPGFYLVSLGVRDTINDCTDYYADFIQVGSADCSADFEFTVTSTITNSVQFTDKSIGNIGTYFWYFDDGSFSTDTNPAHNYDAPGLYKVGLTVQEKTGLCMDFRIKDVQVGTVDCNAEFTVYVDSTNNTAYFTNSTLGGATDFYWLFGDGSYYVGANPVHKYVAPGYYTVSLNTYNTSNNCMDYQEKVILIGSKGIDVEADFIYQTDFAANKVVFSNKSLGENLTYLWNFGDNVTSTLENPEHTYTEPGYHFVCLTATNSVSNVSKTTCKMVLSSNDASDNCLAEFSYIIDTLTREVTFVDKSTGNPSAYAWDFGDDNASTLASPTHTYSTPGYYFVTLQTVNATTGCESEDYEVLNVGAGNNGIQAFFTYEVDTTQTGSKGRPVDIVGISHGGGSRLSWDFGDSDGKNKVFEAIDISTLRPYHEYASAGKYNCCLTIEDLVTGQTDTYCDTIVITESDLTDIEEPELSQEDNFKVYPNPMQSFTHIDYQLTKTANVNITLYDVNGTQIETLVNTYKPSGKHHIIWKNKGLPNGIYYMVFNTGVEKSTRKIIIQN